MSGAASRNEIRERLKGCRLRATAARLAVLGRLSDTGQPVSPSQLGSENLGRSFDRVTIYRTLAALKRTGLVHAVRGTDGVWRYRAHAPAGGRCPGDHPHFLCLRCGLMSCLPGQRLPRVQVPPGAAVKGKQLLVYGLCPDCAARPKQEALRPVSLRSGRA